MKKSSFLMSLMFGLFVSAVAFSACSSDNDDASSNPLVGTWYTDDGDDYTEITYKADYTCTWREYEIDRITVKDSDTGTYKVDDNRLSIWWKGVGNESPWTTTFTISGDKMYTTEGSGVTWTKK